MDKSKGGLGWHSSDPRGRDAVRASTGASARGILRRPPKRAIGHCALRAPTVFLVRIETIRTKNTVMDKNKDGLGLFSYKIVDCARTGFSSVRNRGSARTASRPRKMETLQRRGRDLSRHV
jgi:hypothetical protein